MDSFWISLFFAAGAAAVAYSKLGKRAGYGNAQNVWILVGISFLISFIVLFVILKVLLSFN